MTDDLYSELAELREDRENLAKEVMHLAAALIDIAAGKETDPVKLAALELAEWKRMRNFHSRAEG
jgi:hypothetical protein